MCPPYASKQSVCQLKWGKEATTDGYYDVNHTKHGAQSFSLKTNVNVKDRIISNQLDAPLPLHTLMSTRLSPTSLDVAKNSKREINDKLKRRIIQMINKEPGTTFKQIRGELQGL